MSRPYQRYQVTELEAIVNGPGVLVSQLNAIDAELEFRSTLSANNLRHAIQKRLKAIEQKPASPVLRATTEPQVRPQLRAVVPTLRPSERQVTRAKVQLVPVATPSRFARASPASGSRPTSPTATGVPLNIGALPSVPAPSSKHKSLSAGGGASEIGLDAAYRILNVSSATSWGAIELSRRQLVARAQPDKIAGLPLEERKAKQNEARRVNIAYRTLFSAMVPDQQNCRQIGSGNGLVSATPSTEVANGSDIGNERSLDVRADVELPDALAKQLGGGFQGNAKVTADGIRDLRSLGFTCHVEADELVIGSVAGNSVKARYPYDLGVFIHAVKPSNRYQLLNPKGCSFSTITSSELQTLESSGYRANTEDGPFVLLVAPSGARKLLVLV